MTNDVAASPGAALKGPLMNSNKEALIAAADAIKKAARKITDELNEPDWEEYRRRQQVSSKAQSKPTRTLQGDKMWDHLLQQEISRFRRE